MGSVYGEQGRYGSCSCRTGEIWVLLIGNRGDMGPVHGEQWKYMGPVHGVQGRHGSCSWDAGKIWFLFMANMVGVGPGQGSGTGKKGSC